MNDPAPWLTEPSSCDFIDADTGLPCAMRRNPGGAWCGYVGLPITHPWYGKTYSDVVPAAPGWLDQPTKVDEVGVMNLFCAAPIRQDSAELCLLVRCHGGLTFSRRGNGEYLSAELWWLGFDCSHSGDLAPNWSFTRRFGGVYRTEEFVRLCLAQACSDIQHHSSQPERWFQPGF